jgi:tRNA U34 5-carboxymethylaminomethyl modifying enzyme MnmG/GidA
MFQEEYDVIVVGAVGSEAAAAAANPGSKPFTMSLQNIANVLQSLREELQRDK